MRSTIIASLLSTSLLSTGLLACATMPPPVEKKLEARLDPEVISPGEETRFLIELPDASAVDIVPPTFEGLVAVPVGRVPLSVREADASGALKVVREGWSQVWKVTAPREGRFTIGSAELRWTGYIAHTNPVEFVVDSEPTPTPTVSASVSSRALRPGGTVDYEVKIENAPQGRFFAPDFGGLRAEGPQATRQAVIILSKRKRERVTLFYKWRIVAPQAGHFTIGPARVLLNGQTFKSEPLELDASEQ